MSMEDALNGVKTYLSANLEAALLAIEAARTVTIPRLIETVTYPRKEWGQYPCMEILPDTATRSYLEPAGPSTEGWDTFSINVFVSTEGMDPEAIQFALIRYEEAIKTIIDADYTFGATFEVVETPSADFSPMVESVQDGLLRQVLSVNLLVRQPFTG